MVWWIFMAKGLSAGGLAETVHETTPEKDQPIEGWKVECPKEGDQIKVVSTKEGVVLEIYSQRGIGRAIVEGPAKGWPKSLILRLHLKGLESLRLEAGQWGFDASVMSYPPYQTRLRVHGPEPIQEPVDPKSPYWVEVRMFDGAGKPIQQIPREGGYFEVVIPPTLLEKFPQKINIHWIDFYRD
ncbi:MAG: hypothetical protein NZ602_05660 [Thermoguttaceae bacterium]|nr:hypothetical protein [Thermoguttaceae bacterium]